MIDLKICALGDSIFAGYLVNGKSLIYHLMKKGYSIDNYGVNGLTSDELLSAIYNIINYDIYLIHIGLNDILNGYSLDKIFNNILKIIKHLDTFDSKIYICSPYRLEYKNVSKSLLFFESFNSANKKIETFDEKIKAIKSSTDIEVISFYDYSLKNPIGDDLIDGIHPNENLHRKLANYVEELINGHI